MDGGWGGWLDEWGGERKVKEERSENLKNPPRDYCIIVF